MEDQLKIKMLRDMIRIRVFESALYDLARTGAVPGFLHLCLGQEAVAVGCCSAMTTSPVPTVATATVSPRAWTPRP